MIVHVLFKVTLNTFDFGYLALDIWLRSIDIIREKTHYHHAKEFFSTKTMHEIFYIHYPM